MTQSICHVTFKSIIVTNNASILQQSFIVGQALASHYMVKWRIFSVYISEPVKHKMLKPMK